MSRKIDPSFSAALVKREINNAIDDVRKSLDATRNPQHPEDVPHTYDDKFRIVELVSRAALTVQMNTLTNGFALSPEIVKRLQEGRGKKTVTLRLDCSTECKFRETRTRDEKDATRLEKQGIFGKTTYQSVTTITEHFWDYSVAWAITAFTGSGGRGDGELLETLLSRTGTQTIMTRSKEPSNPLPEKRAFDPIDVEITWLLNALSKTGALDFTINRANADTCHTPRRNPEVDTLLLHAERLSSWCDRVRAQVERTYRDGYNSLLPEGAEVPNFGVIDDEVFLPVAVMLSLEENPGAGAGASAEDSSASPAKLFSASDFDAILSQQQAQMQGKVQQLRSVLPDVGGVISPTEATVVVCAGYSKKLWGQYSRAVQAVEDMLMNQLVAAIGKRLGPDDFAKYMNYHNRQLYRPAFAPKGFCYSVRRPDHYPEGVLSLEDSDDQPVPTTCLHRPDGHPMKFALSAAVEVAFEGEHYVHSVVFHKFSNAPAPRLSLIARARQFSSFILMLGSLNGADIFQPTHALIIQNKDELIIPLILETIPAPQEFRDAIESLSPEQQAFCKAYRKMQLAGSLFAVAVVQIKPQLERLLNLPNDALTKEVKMCQELMQLFIEYQIPSDLLAYAGPENATGEAKLAAVKGYVKAIFDMLNKAKEEELEEERRRYEKEHQAELARQRQREQEEARIVMRNVSRSRAMPSSAPGGAMMMKTSAAPPMPMMAMSMAAPPPPMMAMSAAAPPPPKMAASTSTSTTSAPAPAPAPAPATSADTQPADTAETALTHDADGAGASASDAVDYTQLPSKLDANFDKYDKYNSLRATTIKLSSSWAKSSQRGLLSKRSSSSLNKEAQRKERSRAFDLLDALSKSGALTLGGCTLHIVLAATHCFDLDLLNTVVQDNINPIDRVEASGLIMASTIFATPAAELVQDAHAERIANAELSDSAIVPSS